jgi:phosphoribosylformylglycinamidine (FGAM) synthase-like amidotransferase family enzyme
MPHPERCTEPEMGSADGRRLFDSMLSWLKENAR